MVIDLTEKERSLLERDLVGLLEATHNFHDFEGCEDLAACPVSHFEDDADASIYQALLLKVKGRTA